MHAKISMSSKKAVVFGDGKGEVFMQDLEIELKFGVVGRITNLEEALTGIGDISDFKIEDLVNTYFDTEDEYLFKRGAGLRIRRAPSFTEQTLKIREENLGGLHKRSEFNIKVDDSLKRPDLTLFDQSIFARQINLQELNNKLKPVCTINFIRSSLTLKAFDCTFEVSLDEGEISSGGECVSINELEVELKNTELDGSKLLNSFVSLLKVFKDRELPLTLEPFSKMHRASLIIRGQERNVIELPPLAQTDLHRYILTILKGFETLLGLFLIKKDPFLLGYIGHTLTQLRKALKFLSDIDELNENINDSEAFKRYQKFVRKTRRKLKSLSGFFNDFGEELTFSLVQHEKPDLDAAVSEVRTVLMHAGIFMLPLRIRALLSQLDDVVRANIKT